MAQMHMIRSGKVRRATSGRIADREDLVEMQVKNLINSQKIWLRFFQ